MHTITAICANVGAPANRSIRLSFNVRAENREAALAQLVSSMPGRGMRIVSVCP